MKLYSVKNWSKHYENNRTRDLITLRWIPVPVDQDGDGYTILTSHPDASALLGCWLAIVQVAAKCGPRGTLLRKSGKPHDASSIARMARLPEKDIQRALDVCESECKWLEIKEVAETCGEVADKAHEAASSCIEGKGREGKGNNYNVERSILKHLNRVTGHDYRPVDSTLVAIRNRLGEVDGDVPGVIETIDSKVAEWRKDPKMAKYLRPETLFGKEKFSGYYGQRKVVGGKINAAATGYSSMTGLSTLSVEEMDKIEDEKMRRAGILPK